MVEAPPYADLVLLGEPSVACREGRILALGARDRVLDLRGGETEVLDLGTARILPGLHDDHCHVTQTGIALTRLALGGLDLEGVRAAVARRARAAPPGEWIRGTGFSLDALALGRTPAAADLDDVAPDHPVQLASHDLHALWVNTAGLLAAGRPASAPSYLVEDDVRAFRDETGREGPAERLEAARAVQPSFHAAGITSVRDHGILDDLTAYAALALAGELLLRVRFSIRDHEVPEYLSGPERWPEAEGLLEVIGQKMFLDGALGSRTAWMLEPYEGTEESGHRALPRATAAKRVRFAALAGLPTFFHAIGDAAVREALDLAATAPGLPHVVEHAQHIHEADLPRFAALGVAASLQPVHLLTDTAFLVASLGEARARRSFPVRSLLAAGAEVRLGSDTPVETLDPMKGVFAAAARRTLAGARLPGEEAVSLEAALSLYFSHPAIAPGRPADLVAFAEDPARLPVEALPDLAPIATVFAGMVVHRA